MGDVAKTADEPTIALPLIAGCRGGSGPVLEVRDPARPSDVVGFAQQATAGDVARAYVAAGDAARPWARTPAAARAAVLYRAADILDRDARALAADLVREEGKILADAFGEVQRSASTLRYFAGSLLQPAGYVFPPERAVLSLSRQVPVGVVAVITPFNYPMLIPAWKIGAALAFGNVAVWKCSELVPVSASHFAAALVEAGLPSGVLNLVIGGAELGESMMESRSISALTFTGSTSVGRDLAVRMAGRGVRLQLELGGKNPAVVLDDADIESAAAAITNGAMAATGQKCTAISLVIATPGIYDQLRDALARHIGQLVLGHGLDSGTEMGPLVTAAAAGRVHSEIRTAIDRGARLVVGEFPHPDDGHFVTPALLDGVADDDPLLTREVFGPLLVLVRAKDSGDAVARANRSPYGLNAALFTNDLSSGMLLALELDAGMVHINAVSGFPSHIPFGGVKTSGFGPLEQGNTAVDFFTETRVLNVHPEGSRRR